MKYLDAVQLDCAILKFNRILNEADTEREVKMAEAELEKEINQEFMQVLPYKYTIYSMIPFDYEWMKEKIKVCNMSHSLCIEFPESFDKEYSLMIKMFTSYVEESWAGRVKIVYEGNRGPRYIIKLVPMR